MNEKAFYIRKEELKIIVDAVKFYYITLPKDDEGYIASELLADLESELENY